MGRRFICCLGAVAAQGFGFESIFGSSSSSATNVAPSPPSQPSLGVLPAEADPVITEPAAGSVNLNPFANSPSVTAFGDSDGNGFFDAGAHMTSIGTSNPFFDAGSFSPSPPPTPSSQPTIRSSFSGAGFQMPQMPFGGGGGSALPLGPPGQLPGFDDAKTRAQIQNTQQDAKDMVKGLLDGFLNNSHLQPGELQCLEQGASEVSGDLGMVTEHCVLLMKQVLGLTGDSDNSEDSEDSEASPFSAGSATSAFVTQPQGPSPQELALQQQRAAADEALSGFYGRRLFLGIGSLNPMVAMEASALFLEVGMSFSQMMKLTHEIVLDCVKGDALATFHLAMEHMKDLHFLERHFLGNGGDVLAEMADAVKAFEAGDKNRFGNLLGQALRKIVLSKQLQHALPKGIPAGMVMENVTEGFAEGFFGKGATLMVDSPEDPEHPIKIDLHQCVGNNLNFFQKILQSTNQFFHSQHQTAGDHQARFQDSAKERAQFTTGMAMAMMQMPIALKQCNLNKHQESMLIDGLKSMGTDMKFDFVNGGKAPSKQAVANSMATVIKDWSQFKWNNFGRDSGSLMQAMAHQMFPEKYSIDEDGRLKQLLEEAEKSWLSGNRSVLAPVALACGLALLLAAAVAVRSGRRLGQGRAMPVDSDTDVEADRGLFLRSELAE